MKKILYGLIIGIIITSGIGVLATDYLYRADQVSYDGSKPNVQDALDELFDYSNEDLVVATWMNDKHTGSLSFVNMSPNYIHSKYMKLNDNGSVTILKSGRYIIYYQVASDGVNNTIAYINVVMNNNSVGSCNSKFARCDNKPIYYETNANENDVLEIQAKSGNSKVGARAVVNVIKLSEKKS